MRWIILLLLFPAAMAAQGYRITGKVVDDATGDPLIGANVLVRYTDGTDSTRTHGAATDANGGFVVLLPSKGEPEHIRLLVSYLGYLRYTSRLHADFQRGEMILGSIALKADYIYPPRHPWDGLWDVWDLFKHANRNATNFRSVMYHEQIMALPLF